MKNIFKCLATCLLLPSFLWAQNAITGRVVNAKNGEPVIGAVVLLSGTYYGTTTDIDGNFTLHNVKCKSCCIELSYVGFLKDTFCNGIDAALSLRLFPDTTSLEEIIVNATRANENTAQPYTTLTKEELAASNFGQDLPYLLDQTPSVVTTSDAGTGFGYTGIRIRGSDNTRVNVTINGIPVNDAESQGTFWVDLPDVVSSVDNIQVQRGVGTSTNGAGAFGGSINLQTDGVQPKPYGEVMTSGGSFNTFRTTLKAGSGLMENGWSFDTRLSKIQSDGFVDRGTADLKSWYVSGAWYGKNLAVKAIAFSGHERTYQSWYGVPEDSLRAGNRTFNAAGMYFGPNGEVKYYENQTDNYTQDYYQLHFLFRGNNNWNFNAALHATKGLGYYEEYKQGENLAEYGFDTSLTTDLVRRKWLDNWFYGITYGAQYDSHKKMTAVIGGAINNYEGEHYDQIIWAQNLPAGTEPVHQYNYNFANKLDGNIFTRINYQATQKLNAFIDLQFRNVNYHFTGLDTSGNEIMADVTLNFFNPKAGVTYRTGKSTFYYSFSTAKKEPNRDDYRNSTINSRPLPELLYDSEAGWKFGTNNIFLWANLYYMHYVNQLVLTGKVNDVGAYTRVNVPKSYRAGIEIESKFYLMNNYIILSQNFTYSINKIGTYLEYLDDYDNGGQLVNVYSNTDLAFSPSEITNVSITYTNKKGFRATLSSKTVGAQFLDNTSSDLRKLDSYSVANLRVSYSFKPKFIKEITAAVLVNNLLNQEYASNGYTYGYKYGGETSYYNNYFPQAGINFLGMVTLKF